MRDVQLGVSEDQQMPASRIAELETSNRSLKRHVRALSHDLRSPIAATVSGLRLLAQFGDRMQEPDRREILERSVGRLTDLIEQMDSLLDEATIDHGQDLAPTDVTLAVQWVLATLSRADEERLTTVLDEIPRILGRRVALRQILQNVVSNTLRHNEGPLVLFLTHELVDGMVHLHLDDDGKGFPDDLDAIRRDGTSSSGSTGLGLTTIELAIERLGGRMELGTSPRGGARVTLVLQPAEVELGD